MTELERAIGVLEDAISHQANAIDQDANALGSALLTLEQNGLLGLRRPAEFGGPAWEESDFRAFQEAVARVSGTLAFLQTQHQSAVNLITKYASNEFKVAWLPKMHAAPALMGIGFSQLRRPGPPALRAVPADGGYRIEGSVPWATGESFFQHMLIGAALPDDTALFGTVPFESGSGVKLGEPMRLAALETARTVEMHFDGYFMPEVDAAFIQPKGWIFENDMVNVALQAWFALGCARAGIDIVEAAINKKGTEIMRAAREALLSELSLCRTRIVESQSGEVPWEGRVAARAWAIELAVRCAHAGVAASSGAANSMAHSAQRVYREALVYTVSAQTGPIMDATLRRIARLLT